LLLLSLLLLLLLLNRTFPFVDVFKKHETSKKFHPSIRMLQNDVLFHLDPQAKDLH